MDALGNGTNRVTGQNLRFVVRLEGCGTIQRAQRTVTRDQNVVLATKIDQAILLQVRVSFHLIDCWGDLEAVVFQQLLQLSDAPIADSNAFRFTGIDAGFHAFPSFRERLFF